MKQQKDTPEVSQWRYWTTAPETVDVPAALLEPLVPPANRRAPFPPELTVRLPAAELLKSNVPRLKLSTLQELLPEHVHSTGGQTIGIPAQQLARYYSLIEHAEEILPPQPEPEAWVEPVADEAVEPTTTAPEVPFEAAVPEPSTAPQEQAPAGEPWVDPAQKSAPKPARGPGLFGGLPIFRRRSDESPAAPVQPAAPEVPSEPEAAELPPPPGAPLLPPKPRAILPPMRAIPAIRPPRPVAGVAEIPPPPSAAGTEPSPAVTEAVPEPAITLPPPPEPVAPAAPPSAAQPEPVRLEREETTIPTPIRPVRVLETEAVSERSLRRDIPDEEGLQALFLTEERLTVPRVVELCGGLPGINSCVLTHGSMVITAHNAPANVDLISLSAHAADMLRAMRESTARMGVGMVPAVTLHTEKGVISFFSREDLTMLVFHKDRGFVPGVREKIAAALGELTKANLTLPAGEAESGK